MRISSALIAMTAATILLFGGSASAEELSDERIEALVQILKERGVIEESDAEQIIEKNDAYEQERSWLSRISLFGDFRGRVESFDFADRHNRTRLRYRLRLGAKVDVNDYADVEILLASGGISNSNNQSLGNGGGNDFGDDPLFIDKAVLKLTPFGKGDVPIPTATDFTILFGKMGNPFNSKIGKDLLLWDSDHTPEGIAASMAFAPSDWLDLDLDAAYFVNTENSGGKDEDMFAVQLDATTRWSETFTETTAVSFYRLNDLSFGGGLGSGDWEDRNINRGGASGSAFFGNTDGVHRNGEVKLLDVRETLKFTGIENVPVLVYGRWIKNLSATSPRGNPLVDLHGPKDTAWSVGLEVGDKKKNLKIGAGYFYVEADAVPSSLIDSDLFDGHTNAKGWAFYATRQLWTNTDLAFTAFMGNDIDPYIAVPNQSRYKRVRMQSDVKVKF